MIGRQERRLQTPQLLQKNSRVLPAPPLHGRTKKDRPRANSVQKALTFLMPSETRSITGPWAAQSMQLVCQQPVIQQPIAVTSASAPPSLPTTPSSPPSEPQKPARRVVSRSTTPAATCRARGGWSTIIQVDGQCGSSTKADTHLHKMKTGPPSTGALSRMVTGWPNSFTATVRLVLPTPSWTPQQTPVGRASTARCVLWALRRAVCALPTKRTSAACVSAHARPGTRGRSRRK